MSEIDGRIIGYQRVTPTQNIEPRTPEDFGYVLEEQWRDNLKFDPEVKWTDENGIPLREGSTFSQSGYLSDFDVEANWLKRVEAIAWCGDSKIEDLPYIVQFLTVTPGSFGEHDTVGSWSFFRDDMHPTFSLSSIGPYNILYIPSIQKTFTFLSWWNREPFATNNITPYEDSTSLPFTHPDTVSTLAPVEENYLKKEWAAFLNGTKVLVIVTTNLQQYDQFYHNNAKYNFEYNLDTESVNSRPFMSYPQPIDINPAFTYSAENGEVGRHLILNIPQLSQELGSYDGTGIPWVFKGWYYNNNTVWSDTQNEPSEYYSQTTQCDVWLARNVIVMTAVYMRSTNYYTITYHSGLPDNIE